MVPCPSGIRAVGDGDAVLPLFDRMSVTTSGCDAGVAGSDVGAVAVGDVATTDAVGVTGFMRSPLTAIGVGAGRGDAALETGEGGRTFLR